MKKKILYAIGVNTGGAFKSVIDLSTHLNQKYFDIYILLSNDKQNATTKNAISKTNKIKINIKYIYISKNISLIDIISSIKIYFYLRKYRFDIIHAHSSKAGALVRLAAYFANISVVIYTPHCYYFTAFAGLKRCFYRFIEKVLAKFTCKTIVSGTEQSAAFECNVDKEKVAIIDNALDVFEYEKKHSVSEIRGELNIPVNHIVILGVGRLEKQKNWELFIDVAKIVIMQSENVTFVIAGDGVCKNRLIKRITKLGLNSQIKIIGYVEEISKLYCIADIFISTSKWEGLPYTYLEALYFNIPIIVSETEGINYFTSKGDCICTAKEEPEYFAAKLIKKITMLPNLKLSSSSFPFPLSNCIKQYEKLYNNLYLTTKKHC